MIVRLPPPALPGDRVGIAALSGAVDPARLELGCLALERLGFRPVPARNLAATHDLFAGTARERLDGFHELVDDESVRAIFFARGGHGVLGLLPEIDWALLDRRPRALIGYSDLTPLLNLVPQRLGYATFHGPMIAADLARGLSSAETESLLGALAGRFDRPLAGEIDGEAQPGAAEGGLYGGCLTLLTSLLGTPWAIDLEGVILLLEEVGEPWYRIDRMLTHLALSGSLAGVKGVALGELHGSDDSTGRRRDSTRTRVGRLAPGRPLLVGLPIGHRAPNWTVPIGLSARLDAVNGTLTVGLGSNER